MPAADVSPFVLPEAWVYDRESHRSRMSALAAAELASGAAMWVAPWTLTGGARVSEGEAR